MTAAPLIVQQTKLRAWNNYVLVRMEQPRDLEIAAHGLVIPTYNGGVSSCGVVASVGPDVRAALAEGDRVVVPPYGIGVDVTWNHVDYKFILDNEVLGRWQGPPDRS